MTHLDRSSRILVVCHDAGGAEVVSSWVAHHSQYNYAFIIEGPAADIFSAKLGRVDTLEPTLLDHPPDKHDLTSLVDKYNLTLTGSSMDSNLERRAIQFARCCDTRV